MFALFFSLYFAMFRGTWTLYSLEDIGTSIVPLLNGWGTFFTSIFGDNKMENLGSYANAYNIMSLASLVLALITSIGIVVMAAKGVKKAFGIFFMGIR